MLTFSNPGEIDPRMTQLFGVNVKESESAIGHFGTGLKYAIAIVLRLGGTIQMSSGLRNYSFYTTNETIRGKEFKLVYMAEIATHQHAPDHAKTITQLPFTLELGKDWLPWQAYRELWSNTKDEDGEVSTKPVQPQPGWTHIQVSCPELDNAHRTRREFILESKPLFTHEGIEVHRGGSANIFYQGLKVYTADKPGAFTYNITNYTKLTEDRSLADWWNTRRKIISSLMHAPQEHLGPVLLTGDTIWEWNADWDVWTPKPQSYLNLVQRLAVTHRFKLPASIITSALPKEMPAALSLTRVETMMLVRAKEFLQRIGHQISAPIVVVESLGDCILGSVHEQTIYLTREAFRQGTKIIAGTLLEEHIHLTLGFIDTSRAFQNHLLNLAISLGEELQGQPL